MFGGRLGAKTVTISKILLALAMEERLKVLGVREYMQSIKHSVHGTLSKQVREMGLSGFYEARTLDVLGKNGSLFDYAGLSRGYGKGIKSYEDFDIAWVEEAETIKERSLDNLIPTIRKEGSEIWLSFNPEDEFNAVYSRFVTPYLDEINSKGFHEDDKLYVCKITYYDNPFLNEEQFEEAEAVKRNDYKKWLWQYGGEVYSDYGESIIKPEWFAASVDAHIKLNFKPLGAKCVGFDMADTGDDKALMGRHGSVVTNSKRWSHGELPEAIDIAFEECEKWQTKIMMYDEIGLGKSMKVHLVKTADGDKIEVTPYNSSSRPRNPDEIYNPEDASQYQRTNSDYFLNARAQDYWGLADRFEATYNAVNSGIYTDPDKLISISSKIDDLDILKSELIKIKRVRNNNTKIQIQSKKDAAKEGIKSPNMADALKMCFANPSPEIFETIDIEFESEF